MLRRIPALEVGVGGIPPQMLTHSYGTTANNIQHGQPLGAYLTPNISQALGQCPQNGIIQLQAIQQQQSRPVRQVMLKYTSKSVIDSNSYI